MFFPMPRSRWPIQLRLAPRAALGITEETDAVVVVVSEERGPSRCASRQLRGNIDSPSLRKILLEQVGHRSKREKAQPEHGRPPAGRDDDERAASGPLTPRVPHSEGEHELGAGQTALGRPGLDATNDAGVGHATACSGARHADRQVPCQSADATGRSPTVSARRRPRPRRARRRPGPARPRRHHRTGGRAARQQTDGHARAASPGGARVEPVEAGLTPLTSRCRGPCPRPKSASR